MFSSAHAAISAARELRRSLKKGAREGDAQRLVREADRWRESGGTGRFPQLEPLSSSRERAEGERRSRRDQSAERLQPRGPDTRDRIELVDRAESTVLLPVGEDLLRSDRPDSRQRIELLQRGAVEMYRACRYTSAGRCESTAEPAPRHHDLLSVGDSCGEVEQLDLRFRRRPTRPNDRIRDTGTVLQPIEPGPPNGT